MSLTATVVRRYAAYAASGGISAVVFCLLLATTGCQADPVAQALGKINSTDAQARLSAANVLLGARTMRVDDSVIPRVEKALQNALKDEDPEVRRVVARGLIPWQKPDLVADASAAMIADLRADDESVRRGAVDVIMAMPTARSTEGLIAALETADPVVRLSAAQTLERRRVQLTPENKLRLLVTLDRVHAAVDAGSAALPALVAMLDEDPALRAAAASAIAHTGDQKAISLAVDRCVDDLSSLDASTRAGAARALSHLGDPRALEPLGKLSSSDEDADVRNNATMAVHVLKQDTSAIIEGLGANDPGMRTAAVRAIGELRDKRPAMTPLVNKLAADSGTDLNGEIVRTLEVCGPLAVDPLIKAIGAAADRSARLRLARALNHDTIYAGMTENQQLTLYNLQQAEQDASVKEELGHVLSALEEA